MMVQVNNGGASLAGRHVDQRPPMNRGSPSAPCMKNGVLAPFLPPGPSAPGRHSYQPSIGTRHRLVLAEARNAAEVVTVSARALISSGPLVSGVPSSLAFTHGGTRPHRIERTRRVDS